MKIVSKILKCFRPSGITIEGDQYWVLTPPQSISTFIGIMQKSFPQSILYLEGTSFPSDVFNQLKEISLEPEVEIARGTIWPKPDFFHISLTEENSKIIAEIFEKYDPADVCHHLNLYKNEQIILAWHDAFLDDPFLVHKDIEENTLKPFAREILRIL